MKVCASLMVQLSTKKCQLLYYAKHFLLKLGDRKILNHLQNLLLFLLEYTIMCQNRSKQKQNIGLIFSNISSNSEFLCIRTIIGRMKEIQTDYKETVKCSTYILFLFGLLAGLKQY